MTLLGVLGRVGKLIKRVAAATTTRVLGCSPRRVPIVCDDLGAHIGPRGFPLLLHVLQVLGAGAGPRHPRGCRLGGRAVTLNQRGLPLFLHLLLTKLLSVALLLQNPVELAIVLVAAALHQAAVEPSQIIVVGSLLEPQIATVLQILAKLFG